MSQLNKLREKVQEKTQNVKEKTSHVREEIKHRVHERVEKVHEKVHERVEKVHERVEKVQEHVQQKHQQRAKKRLAKSQLYRTKTITEERQPVGTATVVLHEISQSNWNKIYAEVDVDYSNTKTSSSIKISPENHSAVWEEGNTFVFDVHDITSDVDIYLFHATLAAPVPIGRVLIPLTILPQPFSKVRTIDSWFEVFPMNTKLMRPDKYCSGIAGTPQSALDDSGVRPLSLLRVSVTLQLNFNPFKAYFIDEPPHQKREDALSKEEFNPRIFKQNALRFSALKSSNELSYLVDYLKQFPQSFLLLPVWVYLCFWFMAWHAPLLLFTIVYAHSRIVKKNEDDKYSWIIIWRSELPVLPRVHPLENFRNAQKQILVVQGVLGDVASVTERFFNAFNWTDQIATIICLFFLGVVCVIISVVLFFIPLHYIIFLIGLIMIIRLIINGFKIRRANSSCRLSAKEIRQLRFVWDLIDEDGDDKLTQKELLNYFKRQREKGHNVELVDKVSSSLQNADLNNDGEISWEEFISAVKRNSKTLKDFKTLSEKPVNNNNNNNEIITQTEPTKKSNPHEKLRQIMEHLPKGRPNRTAVTTSIGGESGSEVDSNLPVHKRPFEGVFKKKKESDGDAHTQTQTHTQTHQNENESDLTTSASESEHEKYKSPKLPFGMLRKKINQIKEKRKGGESDVDVEREKQQNRENENEKEKEKEKEFEKDLQKEKEKEKDLQKENEKEIEKEIDTVEGLNEKDDDKLKNIKTEEENIRNEGESDHESDLGESVGELSDGVDSKSKSQLKPPKIGFKCFVKRIPDGPESVHRYICKRQIFESPTTVTTTPTSTTTTTPSTKQTQKQGYVMLNDVEAGIEKPTTTK